MWVFDPQSIANEEPTTWWWNPLSYVTDEVKAATLAEHFASAIAASSIGQPTVGATQRLSSASTRCGGPGSTNASTPLPV